MRVLLITLALILPLAGCGADGDPIRPGAEAGK
jgi:predicted small lipoprotein YifL